jgi:pyocin large subunit-like protein
MGRISVREARAGKYKAKLDPDGDLRVYDPATRSFAAYNKDGTTKTFFKPGRRGYFDDQPGEPATPRQLQEFPLPR